MPSASVSELEPPAAGGLGRADIRTQFLWYLLVGGLSFLADLAVFTGVLLLGMPVMAALVLGFLVGTLANYTLSRALAFTGGRYRPTGEILRLLTVALVGLALTAALVALLMALGTLPVAAKIIATPIVLVWNYLGRRLFVFHSQMPLGTWSLSARAIERARTGRTRRTRP